MMRTLSIRGFTLIEVIIVVVIFSIILAVAWPNLEGALPGVALKSGSRRLSSTVTYIRQEAGLSGDFYRLVFDLDSQGYFVERRARDGQEQWKEEGKTLLKRYSLPLSVRFEDVVVFGREKRRKGMSYVEFHPDGSVEPFLIHLRNTRGRFVTLSAVSITGRVKIEEGYLVTSQFQ